MCVRVGRTVGLYIVLMIFFLWFMCDNEHTEHPNFFLKNCYTYIRKFKKQKKIQQQKPH